MKKRVFNLIILDASGSMSLIERQAINGVNETIQTIRATQEKHENQEHFLTLVAFNSSSIKVIYDNVKIDKVEELTDNQYRPNCSTPLYDAMGFSLAKQQEVVASADAVLVTVITDGEENSSREYNARSIKLLVESLKEKGWVFTYIGANQDVVSAANEIAITNTLEFSSDEKGAKAMFARDCSSRMRWADLLDSECSSEVMNSNYFDED